MKKLKIIIVLVVIIIIAITGTLIYIYANKPKGGSASENSGVDRKIEDELVRVKNKIDYYAVKTCVNKYYMCFGTEAVQAKSLLKVLDTEYIKSKQITENNIVENCPKYTGEVEATISNMYVNNKTNTISVYIVEGDLREKDTNTISKFKIIVKLDKINKTFGILPQSYVEEKYGKIESSVKVEIPEKIENNSENVYELRNITEESYVIDLFSRYKNELMYNRKLAYQELDEEYSKAKFENFEEYDTFIKNNIRKIAQGKLDKYQKTFENGYTRYVFIDTKGRNYIFKETAPMKYTVIMDTYRVDIPEFLEKYNKATEQEKVILNLNKFMLALNDGDYKYAYSVLADSFKTNNFKTQRDFENYAKSNFFANNKFDYTKFGNDTSTYYTYDVTISDADGKDMNTKTKKFIMVLGSGTKFELSFNV